jgi:hypothetical protein
MRPRVFLLSPANLAGRRAQMVLNERAEFELALKLRTSGARVGDVFQFISGLYFRGKLAYSRAFAAPPAGGPASVVITSGFGLIAPETVITAADLRAHAVVPVDAAEPRYRAPLERDARLLRDAVGQDCDIVLLGSVASDKYVQPLIEIFAERLLFPAEFVGRGDMSRGGLMLRCVESGCELQYVSVLGATLRGKRPPRLPRVQRSGGIG